MVVLSFWELTKITLYNKSYNKRNIKHRYFHYMHHFTRELQDVSNRVDATLNAKGAHAKYWPYFIFIIFVCLFYCLSIFVVLFFFILGASIRILLFSFFLFIFLFFLLICLYIKTHHVDQTVHHTDVRCFTVWHLSHKVLATKFSFSLFP